MVALTFSSIDRVKHLLHSFSPEYGLKKKACRRLQTLQADALLSMISTR
jgi:hypothetical protein